MKTMRALVLLALVSCAFAANLVLNPGIDGCAPGAPGPANNYDNGLGSVDSSTYLTAAPATVGTCLSDFYDVAGTTPVFVSQPVTGLVIGASYDLVALIAGPDVAAATIEIYAEGTLLGTHTTTPTPIGVDATFATVTETFIATMTSTTIEYRLITPGVGALIDAINLDITGGQGDPHFIGFAGQVFDFNGVEGHSYCLISDVDFMLNTHLYLLKDSHTTFAPGTVMNELAFIADGHVVLLNSGGYERNAAGFVTVDGTPLPFGSKINVGPRIALEYKALSARSGAFGLGGDDYLVGSLSVVIKNAYSFLVFFAENGRNPYVPSIWVSPVPKRYLDFTAHILDSSRAPHGIFGQTAHSDRAHADWTIEGEESDYEIPNILSSEFKYNKFVQ